MATLTQKQCPVCKSTDHKQVLNARDFTVSKETFPIHECASCGFRFTNPIPDQVSIGKYYQSEDYISHSNTSKGFINSVYQSVRNYTLKSKRKLVNKFAQKSNGQLLDIGAGTGDFLNEMRSAGWQVKGLEPDDAARKQINARFGIDAQTPDQLFELGAEQFDVVTMWHVLEHVHQLDEYLTQIHQVLKPDGKLIVAVPNFNSLDAEKYGASWAAYDVPRHLYHFHERSMRTLLERHQFKLTTMRIMPFDSFYVSMLSEKYRNGSMVVAFWNGFTSWVTALFNASRCSSIIYLIEK